MSPKKKDPKDKAETSAKIRQTERKSTPHPRKKQLEDKKVRFSLPKKTDKNNNK
jgi:hypothetical protein